MPERGKVHLNMIVTKTGDQGETYLNDGSRVAKSSARIKALALFERISVKLGFFIHECDQTRTLEIQLPDESSCQIDLIALANSFQQEMFDLGSGLCTPIKSEETLTRFPSEKVEAITTIISKLTPALTPLDSFILPQGSLRVLMSHDLRTIIRQAEIQVWEISDEINLAVPQYLNRLSDFWFVLGRILYFEEQDSPTAETPKWEPNQNHERGVRIQKAES